jgi:hypothetical protein
MLGQLLGVALLVSQPAPAERAPEQKSLPTVSGAVGFCDQVGWWAVDVSANSVFGVSVGADSHPKRQLSVDEIEALSGLLAKLPVDKTDYKFGTTETMFTETYVLEVGTGPSKRRYSVVAGLKKERGNQDVAAILRTWIYLRSLFDAKEAIDPRRPYDKFMAGSEE